MGGASHERQHPVLVRSRTSLGTQLVNSLRLRQEEEPTSKIGKAESFEVTIKLEIEALEREGGYVDPVTRKGPKIVERHTQYIWKVLKGFNSTDDRNLMLQELAIIFAKIRIGMIQETSGDEFDAACAACRIHLNRHIGNGAKDAGVWIY